MAHMHYKGTGKIHSFRGLLTDGEQRKIRIQGSVGSIAWRITKFQLMQTTFANTEVIIRIWREAPSDAEAIATITFDNNLVLAAGLISGYGASEGYPEDITIIFDNDLFSRDIYITNLAVDNAQPINYYIELEEVKVSAAGMAQLAVAASRRHVT